MRVDQKETDPTGRTTKAEF